MKDVISGLYRAVGIVTLSLCAATVALAGEQDFTLNNQTGVEIHEIYISPTKANRWGQDLLGEGTMPDGETGSVTFDDSASAALWDIKVVDGEGDSIAWTGLDLTEISTVTLFFEDGKATAEVE